MTVNDGDVLDRELLDLARDAVLGVPFVRDVEQRRVHDEIIWDIQTTHGDVHTLRVADAKEKPPRRGLDASTILVADRITRANSKALTEERINFVDRAGNLCLFLNERYFAQVQGKRTRRKLPAMRAPAYRVLLAWLIDPGLVSSPLRTTASSAGVSRTAVQDMRTRLAEWGYVVGSHHSRVWTPRGRKEARRMWLEGYRTTLRPSLDLGGFRLKGGGPESANLSHARGVLAKHWSRQATGDRIPPWRWSGTEALRHIAGMENYFVDGAPVIHLAVDPDIQDAPAILPVVPSEIYNIRIHRLPIKAAAQHDGLAGWPAAVPHPLLVWSELSCSSDPRVHEAAEELTNTVPEGWL